MRIAIKTLGCKSNRYESDRIFEVLGKKYEVFEANEGASSFMDKFSEEADLLIVNTCTVTNTADRKSRQAIRSFKRFNPKCKVIAFGCGVNVARKSYEEMQEVDYLAANTDEVLKIAASLEGENFSACEYESITEAFEHGMRKRALVKIQDGCNSYCTYCIIPTARGPEFSFSSREIIKTVQEKELAGFREIVLTGINIGQWKEGKKDLGDLFELLIENTKSVRFRISSIEPTHFSENFFKLFKSGRFCHHMHMCLQSGSDSVLKRMRRTYDTAMFAEVVGKFRKVVPDIGLTTDVIVGFPGETEEEFKETCDFVSKIGFLGVHIFPYSKRAKTVASYMKNHVDEETKKRRCEVLRKISVKSGEQFKKSVLGKQYEVLVENLSEGVCSGLTPNYIPVQFKYEAKQSPINKNFPVKLKEVLENCAVMGVLS